LAKDPLELSTSSKPFMRVDEIADRWGTCTRTVRRQIAAGKLPATRFGEALRVAWPDLIAFETKNRD
jgi:excisionase family DNA binding protein